MGPPSPTLPAPLLPSLAGACLVLATLVAAFPCSAQQKGYRLDPVHTRIVFGIDHAGFSTALGTVSGSTGALAFDPGDWRSARLDVVVPLDQLDLGDEDWSHAAQRMLDVGRFPQARFVSSSIEPVDASHAAICGTLTLHGVARPLCLQATFNQLRREPVPPFRRTAGFSATATLSRSDFGVDAWKSMVGDEVTLRIEVEAVRDGDALDRLGAAPITIEARPDP
jgi:polyisoprenoid-binding protein YceI